MSQMIQIEWILDNVMPEEPSYCENCWFDIEGPCIERYELAVNSDNCRAAWGVVLEHKREDSQYDYVVESLRMFGQLVPSGYYRDEDGKYHHSDGHHRLAAAIDLGWSEMEYDAADMFGIRDDSGSRHPDEWTIEVNEQRLADLLFQS